jgi:hypothetical protein
MLSYLNAAGAGSVSAVGRLAVGLGARVWADLGGGLWQHDALCSLLGSIGVMHDAISIHPPIRLRHNGACRENGDKCNKCMSEHRVSIAVLLSV